MSFVILNKSDYFSCGLREIIHEAETKDSKITVTPDIEHLEGVMKKNTAKITFISEWSTKTQQERDSINKLITAHPGTLFIIFFKVPPCVFEEYIYIRSNVIVMAKNISLQTLKNLIACYKARNSSTRAGEFCIDKTLLSFTRRESEILHMWMAQRSSEEISHQPTLR